MHTWALLVQGHEPRRPRRVLRSRQILFTTRGPFTPEARWKRPTGQTTSVRYTGYWFDGGSGNRPSEVAVHPSEDQVIAPRRLEPTAFMLAFTAPPITATTTMATPDHMNSPAAALPLIEAAQANPPSPSSPAAHATRRLRLHRS